jgi:signal transduction histidine kinase
MMKLKHKLALFNMLSKLAISLLLVLMLPYVIERINLRQIDLDLIRKREQVIDMIMSVGIEPFISSDTADAFGSYNILKEEFVSLERMGSPDELNFIEVARRLIDDEEIDFRVLNYSLVIDGQPYLLEVGKSIESIALLRRNITRVMVLFIILIILITLFADYQFTNIILLPLDRITGKLKKTNDPLLFNRTPVATTTSDFNRLDEALNSMMKKIGELFSREKEITVNISHELMTPISVIRTKLENLLISGDINQDAAVRVEDSLRTLYRLQSLVNSLLMIARIEGSQYLKNDEVDIGEVLKEVANELEPMAEDKNIELLKSICGECIVKNGNKSLIFSMVYNIVNNSVRNTAAGGRIEISCHNEGNACTLRISDTGKGLTEKQLAHLFERFKSRDQDSEQGTGIGLAITKAIADFHGISLHVESEKGRGTNFFFIFPGISS